MTSILAPDDSAQSLTYDALGDPLSLTNPDGQATSYVYNASGEVTSITLADGTVETYAYDSRGNLITATAPAGITTLTYNSSDELTKVAYPSGLSITYAYNPIGLRTQMVELSGSTVTETVNYTYNALDQLTQLTNGSSNLIIKYAYNNVGELAREDKGDGTYTTYGYNAGGQLLNLTNFAADNTVDSSFQYTYNALGEQTSMATKDGTWTYSYDNIGELIHAALASTNPSVPSQDLTYVYNAAGDRTQTIVNGVTSTYTSNSVDEYTTVTSTDGTTSYTYNPNGDLVSSTNASGTTTYTYNSLNELTSVTSPTDSWVYEYDGSGDVVATIHNGQRTENLDDSTAGGTLAGQYSSTGNLVAGYTYGLGLVSQVTPTGSNYYQFDGLGSTVGMTNATSGLIASYSYLPSGSLLSNTGTVANPFTFVGQFGVTTDGSGLYAMGVRSYHPTTGQFTSNDPSGIAGGSLNLRTYADNDPVQLVDPSGFDTTVVTTGTRPTRSFIKAMFTRSPTNRNRFTPIFSGRLSKAARAAGSHHRLSVHDGSRERLKLVKRPERPGRHRRPPRSWRPVKACWVNWVSSEVLLTSSYRTHSILTDPNSPYRVIKLTVSVELYKPPPPVTVTIHWTTNTFHELDLFAQQ